MQYEPPQYETQDEHQHKNLPDEAEHKLGSAQPDSDPVDAVGGPGPVKIPSEFFAADSRPVEVRVVEGIPAEAAGGDFMTPEGRPVDARP